MTVDLGTTGPRIEQFSGPGYRGCRLSGEIDFTSSGAVQSALLAMILPGGGAMIVDLSRITFLDSSGLGVLVQAHRTATRARHPAARGRVRAGPQAAPADRAGHCAGDV